MVSAPLLDIYDCSAKTLVEVYTDTRAKVFVDILLQKCAAAKHFHPIVYYSKKFNNVLIKLLSYRL